MVRRHLGISVGEWDQLPWWQQQLYVDGLEEEFGGEEGSRRESTESKVFDLDEDPDALAQFGVVRQVV